MARNQIGKPLVKQFAPSDPTHDRKNIRTNDRQHVIEERNATTEIRSRDNIRSIAIGTNLVRRFKAAFNIPNSN